MRQRGAVAALLVLAACDSGSPAAPAPLPTAGAGATLERAAIAAGVVRDPATLDPAGAYGSDTDRLCVVADGERYRVGASVDYGEGQACLARGEGRGRERLRIDFGAGCTLEAMVDGERIAFPAAVPAACAQRCSGRATLSALSADRLSGSATEARSMRASDGRPLCG